MLITIAVTKWYELISVLMCVEPTVFRLIHYPIHKCVNVHFIYKRPSRCHILDLGSDTDCL